MANLMKTARAADASNLEAFELDFHSLCRLCGNMNINLLSVYTDDGAETELLQKIANYLNISICYEDVLPKRLCIHCSNTLASWNSFYLSCQETNSKFHTMIDVAKEPEETEAVEELEEDVEIEEHIEFLKDEENFDICQEGEFEEDLEDARSPDQLTTLCFREYPVGEGEFSEVDQEEVETYDLEGDRLKDLGVDVGQEMEMEHEGLFFRHCGVLQCPRCELSFKLRREFKKHLIDIHGFSEEVKDRLKVRPKIDPDEVKRSEIVHRGKVAYKCDDCGKILMSLDTFVWHRQIHTGLKLFACPLCQKSFRIHQGLNRHLREVHLKEKSYSCEFCSKTFSNYHTASEHRRLHTEATPYECEICGKTFRQKAGLFIHRKIHDPVLQYVCECCNQGFRARYALQHHMKIHTGEKEHECSVCEKRFRLKAELKRHLSLHSNEKPFQCQNCLMSFRMKRYLKRHMKGHHNIEGVAGSVGKNPNDA